MDANASVDSLSAAADARTDNDSFNDLVCDGCGSCIYYGARYKCQVCLDFDYCDECFTARRHEHEESHSFSQLQVRHDLLERMPEYALEAFRHVRYAMLVQDLDLGNRLIMAQLKVLRSFHEPFIAAVAFYLTLGRPDLAEQVLTQSDYLDKVLESESLLDERISCLALLQAIIKITCHCDYDGATAMVSRVEKIFLDLEFPDTPEVEKTAEQSRYEDLIQHQSALWSTENPQEYDDKTAPISDVRVLLEVYRLQFKSLLQVSGSISINSLSEMTKRLLPLLRLLSARKRREIAYECIATFDIYRTSRNLVEFRKFYRHYSGLYKDPFSQRFMAEFFCKIAAAQLKINEGEESVNRARGLLVIAEAACIGSRCLSGVAECKMHQICAEPPHSTSEEDKLKRIFSTLLTFKDLAHRDMHRLAWEYNIKMATTSSETWNQCKKIHEHLLAAANQVKDVQFAKILEIDFAYLMTRRLGTAVQSTKRLEKLLAGEGKNLLPPFLYAKACRGLCRAFRKLRLHDRALRFADLDFKSKYAEIEPEWKSQAVEAVELRRYHCVERETKCFDRAFYISLDTSRRQELFSQLKYTVSIFEDWIPWDDRNKFQEMRREKICNLLDVWRAMAQLELTEDPEGYMDFCKSILSGHDAHADLFLELQKAMVTGLGEFPCTLRADGQLDMIRQFVQVIRNRPTPSRPGFSINYTIALIMELGHKEIMKTNGTSEKLWRVEQFEYLLKDLDTMLADRKVEEILLRVPLWCGVLQDCLKLLPVNRDYWLWKTREFFKCVDDAYLYILKSLESSDIEGVEATALRRRVLAESPYLGLHDTMVGFYLSQDLPQNAWRWLKNRRGRTIFDLLEDYSTMHVCVSSVIQGRREPIEISNEERRAIGEVMYSTESEAGSVARVTAWAGILHDSDKQVGSYSASANASWPSVRYVPLISQIIVIDWYAQSDEMFYLVSYFRTLGDLKVSAEEIDEDSLIEARPVKYEEVIQKWHEEYRSSQNKEENPTPKTGGAMKGLKSLFSKTFNVIRAGDLIIVNSPDASEHNRVTQEV